MTGVQSLGTAGRGGLAEGPDRGETEVKRSEATDNAASRGGNRADRWARRVLCAQQPARVPDIELPDDCRAARRRLRGGDAAAVPRDDHPADRRAVDEEGSARHARGFDPGADRDEPHPDVRDHRRDGALLGHGRRADRVERHLGGGAGAARERPDHLDLRRGPGRQPGVRALQRHGSAGAQSGGTRFRPSAADDGQHARRRRGRLLLRVPGRGPGCEDGDECGPDGGGPVRGRERRRGSGRDGRRWCGRRGRRRISPDYGRGWNECRATRRGRARWRGRGRQRRCRRSTG